LDRRLGGPQNRLDDVEKTKILLLLGPELQPLVRKNVNDKYNYFPEQTVKAQKHEMLGKMTSSTIHVNNS
jgi:hypothetical protein